ncbi:MAG: hypothetical protein ABSG21_17505 [Spirochaetia bacterium]|jgi:hypothetical protein
MSRDLRFETYHVNDDDSGHGPGCNCLDCWLAHGKKFVDERGVPLDGGHGPACSCPECQETREMENEVIVDKFGRPVDFSREWRRERRRQVGRQ